MKLNQRQFEILKIIVDEFTSAGEPVSSKLVFDKYELGISAQTIRNQMAELEKLGLIEKKHTSSGRIPTQVGLEYYNENTSLPQVDSLTKERLKCIFSKRESEINQVIEDSLKILSEITSLPNSSKTYRLSENLREVNMIQLDEHNALLVLVTSFAAIYKSYLHIKNQSQFDDTKTCIRLFNKHLIGTYLTDLKEKLREIEPIIKEQVKEYNYVTEEIIKKLFDDTCKKAWSPSVQGLQNIFNYEEFLNPKTIEGLFKILESTSIWKQIESDFERDELKSKSNHLSDAVKIEFTKLDDVSSSTSGNIVIASTNIKLSEDIEKEISIVGPVRTNVNQIKGILLFLKEQIEKFIQEKNKNANNE